MHFPLILTGMLAAASTTVATTVFANAPAYTGHSNAAANTTIEAFITSMLDAAADDYNLAAFFMKPATEGTAATVREKLSPLLAQLVVDKAEKNDDGKKEGGEMERREYWGQPPCIGVWGVCYGISAGPPEAGPCKC
ncbi:hypothetical protein LTR85_011227 [Meristemomyces frigidus]|nr:hypothetical protein LTR85_011227 [Meristemomyces frigidus]